MRRFFILGFLFSAIVFGGTMFLVSALWAENVSVGATVPAICGNNVAEGSEECDGSDLKSQTCVTRGFTAGTLSCSACVFNTSNCSNPSLPPVEPPAESCGNGACGGAETCSSCPGDCGACPPSCGDISCNGTETCSSCPGDCGVCPPSCGDLNCNGTESCSSCPGDCGACLPSCGDASCNGEETCSSCPGDCGACSAICGDNVCGSGENCLACPGDCGVCPAEVYCGDSGCNGAETCSSCPGDCGVCGTGPGGSGGGGEEGEEPPPAILPATLPVVNPFVGEVVKEVFDIIKQNKFVREQVRKVQEVTRAVQNIANIPKVEETAKNVIAPTAVITSAAVITPSLASILIPFLRFLFFQPLLLLGRRKRKEWGMVYNSMNKMPVGLATVRLVDTATNKIVQSRVTDAQGRYLFIVKSGSYLLEVAKPGFIYPSALLARVTADGRIPDLYHGERVDVSEQGMSITPNIPVDPVEVKVKSVRRIVWERFARVFQYAISLTGIAAALVALYIAPVWYVWAFLAVHIFLYAMFLRFVRTKKPKGWGIVYDKEDKEPLGRVITRLFSKEYDKLVASQITDSKGLYAFLAGPSNYYVTFEKKGYRRGKSRDIILKDAEDVVVKEDVLLEKEKGETGSFDGGTRVETQPPAIPPDDVLPVAPAKEESRLDSFSNLDKETETGQKP